ncbi:hypothetical protein KFK09_025577 [Dendrobium nobile]|uniref:URB1 N-terminal domain-containing protein n=1 Tax=Dendrobium nobile TaxID=94219 RepID=A0A8T3A474_DENNO|nr:hypothetical protein KFK09_025577 [Dendrobium nobile]
MINPDRGYLDPLWDLSYKSTHYLALARTRALVLGVWYVPYKFKINQNCVVRRDACQAVSAPAPLPALASSFAVRVLVWQGQLRHLRASPAPASASGLVVTRADCLLAADAVPPGPPAPCRRSATLAVAAGSGHNPLRSSTKVLYFDRAAIFLIISFPLLGSLHSRMRDASNAVSIVTSSLPTFPAELAHVRHHRLSKVVASVPCVNAAPFLMDVLTRHLQENVSWVMLFALVIDVLTRHLRRRDCTSRFFGSFVAVRLRSFDDFPFLSVRKLRHFDRKQQRELASCEEHCEELEEVMEEAEEKGEIGAAEGFGHPIQTSYRFKLAEILKSLHSPELFIYSEASKNFIYLLRGDSGGDVLREYVQLSPKCAELLEAWRLHAGKPGMSFILSLVSVILGHSDGKSQFDSVKRSLDFFARSLIEYKLEDIYVELNSQESRRQSAALSLLTSIVRRRMGLALEVAKRFDFKLPILSKLCGVHKKKLGNDFKPNKRLSTRRAFVGFAMSFLEAGNPRLLRWILQQKEMYYGVLRGLANDDTDTIIFVLSALNDKLLKVDSLVSPALRSVLFGSATLEQLSFISGNPLAGPAANVAHDVLVIVCTNPQNGLMPGPGLKGNKKRLLDLMKKLKGTEVAHHKQLLLAIVKKEANLCSAYLNEFPYHLEPRSSSSWFSAISLAADLVSTINIDSIIASKLGEKPATSIEDLHETLKCIIPRVFTRSMINKGLLHSDDLVKHGSLRFILELLKSLDDLLTSLDIMIQRTVVRQEADFCVENMASMHNFPGLNYFVPVDEHLDDDGIASFPSDEVLTQHCVALKHYIQNEIRNNEKKNMIAFCLKL